MMMLASFLLSTFSLRGRQDLAVRLRQWTFYSNWVLVANFVPESCKYWPVSLEFQCACFVPVCFQVRARARAEEPEEEPSPDVLLRPSLSSLLLPPRDSPHTPFPRARFHSDDPTRPDRPPRRAALSLSPLQLYLYEREYAYALVVGLIVCSLSFRVSAALRAYDGGDDEYRVENVGHDDGHLFEHLQTRVAEGLLGVLLAFSVLDERFKYVDESERTIDVARLDACHLCYFAAAPAGDDEDPSAAGGERRRRRRRGRDERARRRAEVGARDAARPTAARDKDAAALARARTPARAAPRSRALRPRVARVLARRAVHAARAVPAHGADQRAAAHLPGARARAAARSARRALATTPPSDSRARSPPALLRPLLLRRAGRLPRRRQLDVSHLAGRAGRDPRLRVLRRRRPRGDAAARVFDEGSTPTSRTSTSTTRGRAQARGAQSEAVGGVTARARARAAARSRAGGATGRRTCPTRRRQGGGRGRRPAAGKAEPAPDRAAQIVREKSKASTTTDARASASRATRTRTRPRRPPPRRRAGSRRVPCGAAARSAAAAAAATAATRRRPPRARACRRSAARRRTCASPYPTRSTRTTRRASWWQPDRLREYAAPRRGRSAAERRTRRPRRRARGSSRATSRCASERERARTRARARARPLSERARPSLLPRRARGEPVDHSGASRDQRGPRQFALVNDGCLDALEHSWSRAHPPTRALAHVPSAPRAVRRAARAPAARAAPREPRATVARSSLAGNDAEPPSPIPPPTASSPPLARSVFSGVLSSRNIGPVASALWHRSRRSRTRVSALADDDEPAIRWLGGREFIHPEHTAFFKGYWFAIFLNLVAALLAYVLIEAPITRLVRYT